VAPAEVCWFRDDPVGRELEIRVAGGRSPRVRSGPALGAARRC
jgi:hypothetical protein